MKNEDVEEGVIIYEELESALVGVTFGMFNEPARAVYSVTKCADYFMSLGLTEEEAIEYVDFNVVDAYVGKGTPLFIE